MKKIVLIIFSLTVYSVYPSVTTGILNITSGHNPVPQLKLVASNGTVLQTGQGNTMNISAQPAGIYFLHVDGVVFKITKK